MMVTVGFHNQLFTTNYFVVECLFLIISLHFKNWFCVQETNQTHTKILYQLSTVVKQFSYKQ